MRVFRITVGSSIRMSAPPLAIKTTISVCISTVAAKLEVGSSSDPWLPAINRTAPQGPGVSPGVVTDGSNQMPLEGVGVTAFKGEMEVTSTATESDGSYALSGLPTGAYRVEFSASGFVGLTVDDVEVQAGQTQSLDASLTPEMPETP